MIPFEYDVEFQADVFLSELAGEEKYIGVGEDGKVKAMPNPGGLPSGEDSNTLRHNGTEWEIAELLIVDDLASVVDPISMKINPNESFIGQSNGYKFIASKNDGIGIMSGGGYRFRVIRVGIDNLVIIAGANFTADQYTLRHISLAGSGNAVLQAAPNGTIQRKVGFTGSKTVGSETWNFENGLLVSIS